MRLPGGLFQNGNSGRSADPFFDAKALEDQCPAGVGIDNFDHHGEGSVHNVLPTGLRMVLLHRLQELLGRYAGFEQPSDCFFDGLSTSSQFQHSYTRKPQDIAVHSARFETPLSHCHIQMATPGWGPHAVGISSLGKRVGNWQRQVSALHGRLMGVQALGRRQLVAADAFRLRREITQGLALSRREWEALPVPAPRRAQIELSCLQLIDALHDLESRCGPASLELD